MHTAFVVGLPSKGTILKAFSPETRKLKTTMEPENSSCAHQHPLHRAQVETKCLVPTSGRLEVGTRHRSASHK